MDDVSADSGQSAYTSQPGPNDKDNSTISSQPIITSGANASFTQPITEDSVHSSTILAVEHSIIGSNISFRIESQNMPTYANVDQVLIVPEYKGELHNQPTIAELTEHVCMGTGNTRTNTVHISNNTKEIMYYKYTISIGKSRSCYQRQSCLGFGNIPQLGSRSLTNLRYLSHGKGYPRWTHIRLVQFKLFILFYFYGLI